MSNLISLLDRPVAYHVSFVPFGGVTGAVLLSQLVYWHNRMDGSWFYKTQADIKSETGLTREEQETARKRLIKAGVLEEERRGVPAKLYFRVMSESLESLLLQSAGFTHSSMRDSRNQGRGNTSNKNAAKAQARLRQTSTPACGNPADIHTVDYQETTQETNTESFSPVAAQPDNKVEEFISRHPEAVVHNIAKRQWGNAEDLRCAQWIWEQITQLYEKAAESDGEVVRPKEPNWTTWANDIRLLREQDGRNHKQICGLFKRANHDPFWCRNILSPSKLRDKWDDLSLKLSAQPAARSITDIPETYSDPVGFRCD